MVRMQPDARREPRRDELREGAEQPGAKKIVPGRPRPAGRSADEPEHQQRLHRRSRRRTESSAEERGQPQHDGARAQPAAPRRNSRDARRRATGRGRSTRPARADERRRRTKREPLRRRSTLDLRGSRRGSGSAARQRAERAREGAGEVVAREERACGRAGRPLSAQQRLLGRQEHADVARRGVQRADDGNHEERPERA